MSKRSQAVRDALALRPKSDTVPRLSADDVERLVEAFLKEPSVSFAELGRRFGVTPQTVRYHVQKAAHADETAR